MSSGADEAGRVAAPVVGVAALLAATIAAGADVRGALAAVSLCCAAAEGQEATRELERVAAALAVGVPWSEAWDGVPQPLRSLEAPLVAAWNEGSSPVEPLWAFVDARLEAAAVAGQRAAAELGVRLALPLALCLLPSFVLVGVVPLVLAVASTVVGTTQGVTVGVP